MMDAEKSPNKNLSTTTLMDKYLERERGVKMNIKEQTLEESRVSPSLYIQVEYWDTSEDEDNKEIENTSSDPNVEDDRQASSVPGGTTTSTNDLQPFHCVYLSQSDSRVVSSRQPWNKKMNSRTRNIQVSTVATNDKKRHKRNSSTVSCSQRRKSSRTLKQEEVVSASDKNGKVYCKFCLCGFSNESSFSHHYCAKRCKEEEEDVSWLTATVPRHIENSVSWETHLHGDHHITEQEGEWEHNPRDSFAESTMAVETEDMNLKNDACDPLAADPIAVETGKVKKEEDCAMLQEPLFIAIKQEQIDDLCEEGPCLAEISVDEETALPTSREGGRCDERQSECRRPLSSDFNSQQKMRASSLPVIQDKIDCGKTPFSGPCSVGLLVLQETSGEHVHIHSREKPECCSDCRKCVFSKKGTLDSYVCVHTGERPYFCIECNKSFIRKRHLVVHLCVHTGDRPFSCPYCKKTFAQKQNLTTHVRIHTGEKPFTCGRCNKCFSSTSGLKKHISIHK